MTLSTRPGAVVATPDDSTIADLFTVRSTLEPVAARIAAERATPVDVVDLRTLLDEARVVTESGDLTRVAELNSALHLRVVTIAGNRWLASISASLYLHLDWVFRVGAARRAPHLAARAPPSRRRDRGRRRCGS